jgi:hypothetical protein
MQKSDIVKEMLVRAVSAMPGLLWRMIVRVFIALVLTPALVVVVGAMSVRQRRTGSTWSQVWEGFASGWPDIWESFKAGEL